MHVQSPCAYVKGSRSRTCIIGMLLLQPQRQEVEWSRPVLHFLLGDDLSNVALLGNILKRLLQRAHSDHQVAAHAT